MVPFSTGHSPQPVPNWSRLLAHPILCTVIKCLIVVVLPHPFSSWNNSAIFGVEFGQKVVQGYTLGINEWIRLPEMSAVPLSDIGCDG
jgi:uncharacterized membrane protein YccF (DUF307 family)